MLPNIPHHIIAYLAIIRSGATVVPIAYGLSEYELLPMLEEAEVDSIICWAGDLKVVDSAVDKLPLVKRLIVLGEQSLPNVISLTRLISQSQPVFEPAELDDDDIALIRIGNGRSGRPVAAEITHHSLATNAIAVRDTVEIIPQDSISTVIPLSEIAGEGLALNLFIASGCCIALDPNFDLTKFGKSIKTNGTTVLVAYPSHLSSMASQNADIAEKSTLRLTLCTGGELNEDVLKDFEKQYGGYTLECYTLRDAGPVVAINKWRTGRRVGSLGHPLPGIEMRIVSDAGKECSIGEIGEIVVKGSCGMRNYTGRPRLTTLKINDKWIRSEDYGRMDINGFFYLSENEVERFVVDGKSFYVHEIESILNMHPGVHDAVVVIASDDLGNQKLKACVVPEAGKEFSTTELEAYLRLRLSSYKIPDMIRIYKDLPRMSSGEVDRNELSGFVTEN
jgi:long-chain acyl-CoA synthetase